MANGNKPRTRKFNHVGCVDPHFTGAVVTIIREAHFRKLKRVLLAADEAISWIYVFANKTARQKMKALHDAVRALEKPDVKR